MYVLLGCLYCMGESFQGFVWNSGFCVN
jgi:hypothetical protein